MRRAVSGLASATLLGLVLAACATVPAATDARRETRVPTGDGAHLYAAVRGHGADTLVVMGTRDINPMQAAEEWAAPTAELLRVEGAGHHLVLDARERVLPRVDAFLRGGTPRGDGRPAGRRTARGTAHGPSPPRRPGADAPTPPPCTASRCRTRVASAAAARRPRHVPGRDADGSWRPPSRPPRTDARRAAASSLALWFVADSAASLAHGALFNVLLVNLPCIAALGVPLVALRREFRSRR